jgi:simple sugar transport system substrate-binding protein/ribose transport system substrate-binding protein
VKLSKGVRVGTVLTLAALLAAGCTSTKPSASVGSPGGPSAGGVIGEDYPGSDDPFWNAYIRYVPQIASRFGVTIKETNSANDITKLAANADALVAQGARAMVLVPPDPASMQPTLDKMAASKIPVVAVGTEPDRGKVFMVVRVDSKSYGEKPCMYIGEALKGIGEVVMLEGDLTSASIRDRSEAFSACMKANYPNMKVDAERADGDPSTAVRQLDSVLTGGKIKAIYMETSGYLSATLSDLQSKGLLKPRGHEEHIIIVSNDGVAPELKAIREASIDATVSQPASSYASYGVYYAQQALLGKTFTEGKTDHDSTIVKLSNGNLEDLLSAPLVSLDGGGYLHSLRVDDPLVWGNQAS